MKYRLRDDGYQSYKRIVIGRDVVGMVRRIGEGKKATYVGTIRDLRVEEKNELAAFQEVVARDLGYECAADLLSRNAQVRTQIKAQKRAFQNDVRDLGAVAAVSKAINNFTKGSGT